MATWSELQQYVTRNYPVQTQTDNSIVLVYNTADDRTQLVVLWRRTLMDDEWVEIESPVAKLDGIEPLEALREAGKLVCGGLIATDDMLTLRHAAPLVNLDTNELEAPLAAVTLAADLLEKALTGKDEY